MKEKEYIRLGKGLKRGASSLVVRTRTSLWLGKDHLLSVHNTGYTEEYRRFYYRDIQAITVERTSRGRWINLTLGIAALFSAFFAVISRRIITFPILLSLTCFFSLLLLINWLRGPTCLCRLYTAVSREDLFSLDRSKKALRALELLMREIEDIQGHLTEEQIGLLSTAATGAKELRAKNNSPVDKHQIPYSGVIHKALFYLLLLDGICASFGLFFHNVSSVLAMAAIEWALTILVIIALVRQHGSSMKSGIRGITWLTLGYVCFGYAAGYGIFVFLIFKYPRIRQSQWELLKIFAHLSPQSLPWLTWLYIFSIAASLTAGLTGILLLPGYKPGGAPSSART